MSIASIGAAALHAFGPAGAGLDGTFVVPVVLAAWLFGSRAAFAVSLASSLLAFATDGHNLLALGTHVLLFAGIALFVARTQRAVGRLAFRSDHDALTGLLNRHAFARAARKEIDRAHRHDRPLSVAFLDIDDFKKLNDVHGHLTGDEVLATLGEVLLQARQSDIAARLGGDELVLLMPETDAAAAKRALTRLAALARRQLSARGLHSSFTTGIVTYETPPRSLSTLLQSADALLYEGKRAAKGTIRARVVRGAP